MDLLIRCDVNTATHIFDIGIVPACPVMRDTTSLTNLFLLTVLDLKDHIRRISSIELNFSELNTMIVQYISRYKNSASNLERVSGYHKGKQ